MIRSCNGRMFMTVLLQGRLNCLNVRYRAIRGTATGAEARPHTSSMNNGGTTQIAARSLASDSVIALLDTMLQAPSVRIDMHQIATDRARERLFDMQRC